MNKGRFITSSTITTSGTSYTGSASGMWKLQEQLQAISSSSWPKALSVPNQPVISAVSSGNANAIVSFSTNDTGGVAITGYTVTSSPGNISATGSVSPITVSGLTNNTAYTFSVIATNSQGNSLPSIASSSVTPHLAVSSQSEFNAAIAAGGTFYYVNQLDSSLAETATVQVSPWGTNGINIGAAYIYASSYTGTWYDQYTNGQLSTTAINNLKKINNLALSGSLKIGISGINGQSELYLDPYSITSVDGISSIYGSWTGTITNESCYGTLTALNVNSLGIIRERYSTNGAINGGQGFYYSNASLWIFI